MRIPLKTGDEYTALTRGGRKYVSLSHGQRSRIKLGYRRRLRRLVRLQLLDSAKD